MAGDDSSGSNHALDGVLCMEALRAGLQTQKVALRALVESIDSRFQEFEGRFDAIVDRLNALALGINRDGIENRRWLRGDVA